MKRMFRVTVPSLQYITTAQYSWHDPKNPETDCKVWEDLAK